MTRTGSIKGIRVLGAETTLTAVGNTTETGTLELHELSTNGQHKVSISAPNSLSADYSLTLPGDDGDADQVLTTDGSGILTWEDGGGDGDITSVVAGDGLTGGATSGDATLNVNVDDSTIETNSDTLRIKDSGVTLAKMSNLANMKVIGNTSGGSSTPLAVSILDEDNMSSNSATAVASQQSIKAYVDSVAQGLNLKEACRVATTGAGTLSSSFENGDTIDEVTLSTNDRILIKDQSTASENGIYVVKSSGAPDRSGDMPAGDTASGDFTFITEGTINGDNGFVCTSNGGSDTVGTHNLSFTQFSGAGQITSGDGLTKSGNTLSIDAKSNSGIVIHSTELSFDLGASSITGTLAVGDGGTGATSFSDKAVIITQYSGTDTLAAAVMDANGELLIGGTSGPAVSTLTAGSNITITNSDGGISIASTDTNTQLTDEQVQDLVGAMFSSNTETGITSTYQDGDGTIDLVVGTLNQNTTGNAATATALATARTIGGVSFDGSANINLPGVVSHSRVVYKTLSILAINTTFLEIENGLRIEMILTREIVTFELTLMRLRPNSKVISFDLQNYNASGSPSLLPAIIAPIYDVYAQEPVTVKFTLSDLTIGDTLYVTPMIKATGAYAYLYRSSIYGYMSFTATEFGTADDVDEIGLLYND